MPKLKDRKRLVRELDAIFSRYIRLKDSFMGEAVCVTCGKKADWAAMQNGHFYSRGRFSTRWDEDNCHVQCMRCNVILHGNYIAYTKFMIDRYGREFVDELERKSLTTQRLTRPEMEELIQYYKARVKQLLNQQGTIPTVTDVNWGE